ncbi:hypothetical protein [Microbacterium sp. SL75]|nr:hypothetical protein [Microbacterium sp. SL75]WAC68892.1 hypothetical protein OVA17_15090 [Microbacterium sp. SL75]
MAELDPVRAFALSKALETRVLNDSVESIVETAGKFESYLNRAASS